MGLLSGGLINYWPDRGWFSPCTGIGSILSWSSKRDQVSIVALASLPAVYGLTGYIIGICLLTPGYQLFQAGNNTAVIAHTNNRQDGIISGILNLSRNLGLVTGASVMGALFSLAVATKPIRAAKPEAILFGLTVTFGVGAVLLGLVSIQSWLKSDKPVIR